MKLETRNVSINLSKKDIVKEVSVHIGERELAEYEEHIREKNNR